MNAEQWLIEEAGVEKSELENSIPDSLWTNDVLKYMERFANNRTKELQAAILDYRCKLKDSITKKIINNINSLGETVQPFHLEDVENNSFLKEYDSYFGITVQRQGDI